MIPEVNPYNNYRGDGVATKFDFDFEIKDGSQLVVEKIDENDVAARLVENVDYEIVLIDDEIAGFINFPIEDSKYGVLQNNEILSLQLDLPFHQDSEYGQSSLLDLNSIEFSLDYLTRLCQILKRQMERSVKVKEGSNSTPDELLESINDSALVSTEAANLAVEKANEASESANIVIEKTQEVVQKGEEIIVEGQNQISTIQQVSQLEQEEIQEIINRIDDGKAVYVGENEPTDPVYSVWVDTNDDEVTLDIEEIATDIKNTKADLNTLEYKTSGKITNCITEIPQRLIYEESNGTITLKAGSQVLFPNGFEADGTTRKNEYYTLTSDIVWQGTTTSVDERVLFTTPNNTWGSYQLANSFAGVTAPTAEQMTSAYGIWYDSKNNIVKITVDKGVNWASGRHLPWAIAIQDANGFRLKQVFQGQGYIDSTWWVDEGVKFLIADGKNPDETLKNKEYTTPSPLILNFGTGSDAHKLMFFDSQYFSLNSFVNKNIFYQTEKPQKLNWTGFQGYWYNPQENQGYRALATTGVPNWTKAEYAPIGIYDYQSEVMKNVKFNQPFRAVDWNDNNLPQVDGQWTNKTLELTTATAVGTYEIDLTDYLPNDNYNYEVMVTAFVYSTGNNESGTSFKSDLITSDMCFTMTNTNSRHAGNTIIVPISNSRKIYFKIQTSAISKYIMSPRAIAYRRMGTNI